MKLIEKRRAIAACFRVLHASDDEELYRALDRLVALSGWDAALPVWLATHPDPEFVMAVMDWHLLVSPLRTMLVTAYSAGYQFQAAMEQLERDAGQASALLAEVERGVLAMIEEEGV